MVDEIQRFRMELWQGPRGQTADPVALDAFIARALAEWPVPGLAAVIVKDGKTVLAKGYGVTEWNGSDPVDENTLFAIASNTKAFTVAALAILVEEGKLDWDDRVQDYLPYFQLYDPWVSAEMRIRDLLSHRSGLGTFSGDLLWYGTGYSAEEVVKRTRFVTSTDDLQGVRNVVTATEADGTSGPMGGRSLTVSQESGTIPIWTPQNVHVSVLDLDSGNP